MRTAVMKPEFKVTAMRKPKTLILVGLSLNASVGIPVTAITVFMIAHGETIPWYQWGLILVAALGIFNAVHTMMRSS